MKKGLKRFFESLAYAGLKPDAPAVAPRRPGPFTRLARRFERLIFRGLKPEPGALPPPMTLWQKIRLALAGLLACSIIAALAVMLTEARKPPKEIPSMKDSRVADLLPKELKIESHTSLAVAAIDLDATSTPQQVTGKIRNNGKAVVPVAVLELDLLDVARTKMGSVSTRVQNIGPGQEAPFRVTVPFSGASNVLVRHLSEEPQ